MKKSKKKEIVLAGLALLLILVVTFQLLDTSSSDAATDKKSLNGKDEFGLESIQNKYLEFLNDYLNSKNASVFDGFGKPHKRIDLERDPFQKPRSDGGKQPSDGRPVQNSKLETLKLEGVFWHKKSPSAVINKKIVYVGSRIGRFKVIKIFPKKVIVSSDKEILVLKLKWN